MKNSHHVELPDFINGCVDVSFLIVSLLFAVSGIENEPAIGVVLILISIFTIWKTRKNRYLFYLFIIIGILNISVGYSDMIHFGEGISSWQSSRLRNTEYDLLAAKSVLLFMASMNCFINGQICKADDEINKLVINRKSNKIIAYSSLVILITILAYGIMSELKIHIIGDYSSVANPIFEYSVIVFVLAWLYAKELKVCEALLVAYAVIFSGAFMLIGDRSSASMYLIALLLLVYKNRNRFRIGRVLFVIVAGIIAFNFIGIIRNGAFSGDTVLDELIDRGLYIDTASWAYYSGITIVGVGQAFGRPLFLFFNFLLSIFGIHNDYSSMAALAVNYSSNFYNRGGGFIGTFFYAWFGFLGVFISGLLVGYIVNKVFRGEGDLSSLYKILIIVFVFRWYIYSPIGLFRSVLLVGGIAFFLYTFISKLLTKER